MKRDYLGTITSIVVLFLLFFGVIFVIVDLELTDQQADKQPETPTHSIYYFWHGHRQVEVYQEGVSEQVFCCADVGWARATLENKEGEILPLLAIANGKPAPASRNTSYGYDFDLYRLKDGKTLAKDFSILYAAEEDLEALLPEETNEYYQRLEAGEIHLGQGGGADTALYLRMLNEEGSTSRVTAFFDPEAQGINFNDPELWNYQLYVEGVGWVNSPKVKELFDTLRFYPAKVSLKELLTTPAADFRRNN